MQAFKQLIWLGIILSTLLVACKNPAIIILKKEVHLILPSRELSVKSANYRIIFIPKLGSNELSFQKVLFNEKELQASIYNLKGEKQTAFNPLDTLNLVFSNNSLQLESSDIAEAKFTLYYFEKNELKKISVHQFELITTPINL